MRRRSIIIASILLIATFLKVGFCLFDCHRDNSIISISSNIVPQNGAEAILLDQKIDLNHASLADLVFLPGIGPKLARKILDFREKNGLFFSVDNLRRVRGIGQKKLAQISHFIDVK